MIGAVALAIGAGFGQSEPAALPVAAARGAVFSSSVPALEAIWTRSADAEDQSGIADIWLGRGAEKAFAALEAEGAESDLDWPDRLWTVYLLTGDYDRCEALAQRIASFAASWESMIGPDGLLDGVEDEPVASARYIHAKTRIALLDDAFDSVETDPADIEALGAAYRARYLDSESGLFRVKDAEPSPLANALALRHGVAPFESEGAIAGLLRAEAPRCTPDVQGAIIAACFDGGLAELGYDLLLASGAKGTIPNGAAILAGQVAGLRPLRPGWATASLRPRIPVDVASIGLTLPTPSGRVRVAYSRETGYTVAAPLGFHFDVAVPEGVDVTAESDMELAKRPLTEAERAYLATQGWNEQVGGEAGLWVSVDEQMFRYVQGDTVLWETRCATATNGTGSEMGSNKTPLGWHQVNGKIGADAPWGQVFRARAATKEIWAPGGDTKEDLVLTRVFLLDSLEPGKNQGGQLDSRARYIYIHGTNAEEKIGTPSSHGCIRLRNDDAIAAFELIPDGTKLVITEQRTYGILP